MTGARLLAWLLAAGLLAAATPARAQRWAADLYVGGTQHTALAGRTADLNLIANLRFAGSGETFLYLTGATPLNDDAVQWAAAGLGRRLEIRPGGPAAPLSGGLDVASHAYAYGAGEEPGGRGGTLHLVPYAAWRHPAGRVEVRAGRHEHRLRHDGEVHGRGLYEIGARGSGSRGLVAAQVEARWLADDSTWYPFAGLQLGAATGTMRVWASAGRWLTGGDDLAEWAVGGAVDAGPFGELWAGVRADARDPLFLNPGRTSWNAGLSRPLGRRRPSFSVPPPRLVEGAVLFRLPASVLPREQGDAASVPAPSGPAVPAVAGEFSEWKLLPLRLSGDEWLLQIPLPPGVYRFSFVSPAGEWFVPEGYPGRIPDGMGGWVAVLVVP